MYINHTICNSVKIGGLGEVVEMEAKFENESIIEGELDTQQYPMKLPIIVSGASEETQPSNSDATHQKVGQIPNYDCNRLLGRVILQFQHITVTISSTP